MTHQVPATSPTEVKSLIALSQSGVRVPAVDFKPPPGLKASLSGQLRQTNLPRWKALLPLFEAIMNSIQATNESPQPNSRISIRVIRDHSDLAGNERVTSFSVSDNGVGFNDQNFDSFNTAYSEYKLGKGGKGLGRFSWLKAFQFVDIESFARESDESPTYLRKFRFDVGYDPDRGAAISTDQRNTGTTISLIGFKSPYSDECPDSLLTIAQKIAEHFVLVLLNPSCPIITIFDNRQKIDVNKLFESDFKPTRGAQRFTINKSEFVFWGFRLRRQKYSRHRLVYAANDRSVVSELIETFLPNVSGKLTDENGEPFTYLAVIQSAFLNDRVNNTRTGFEIAGSTFDEGEISDSETSPSFFAPEIRLAEIRKEALAQISIDLADIIKERNEQKSARIESFVRDDAPHYKIVLKRSDGLVDEISPTASKAEIDLALHRRLYEREVDLKKQGSKIILEAAKLNDYDAYKENFSNFIEQNNELGIAALAQYVMHRKIILDLFENAISKGETTDKYPLERVVHDIVFPMRSADTEILYSQQNLWIIDERLNYNTYIASDKQLRSCETEAVDSNQRPDIAIFDRPIALAEGDQPLNSITVIEFKRPQRDAYSASENPVDQVYRVVNEIRTGQFVGDGRRTVAVANNKIPARCYVIADFTQKLTDLLENRDFAAMPDGQGYYYYHVKFGIYCEVIDYGKLLRDAKRRNRVLFDRLNLLSG